MCAYLVGFRYLRLNLRPKGVGSRGNGDPYVPLYCTPKVVPTFVFLLYTFEVFVPVLDWATVAQPFFYSLVVVVLYIFFYCFF